MNPKQGQKWKWGHAWLAKSLVSTANSAVSHRREAQAKGQCRINTSSKSWLTVNRYISKLDERLQNVEGAIRDYVPGAAHRIGKPEPADLSMYDPDHPDDIQPSHPSDMHQAQSGATNHTHLDYTGDGDTSSFWHSAPQMSSATSELVAALQAATSQDLDENALNE